MVLIPEENRKDLVEIPQNVKDKLDIRPLKWIDQALELALAEPPRPRVEPVNPVELAGRVVISADAPLAH